MPVEKHKKYEAANFPDSHKSKCINDTRQTQKKPVTHITCLQRNGGHPVVG